MDRLAAEPASLARLLTPAGVEPAAARTLADELLTRYREPHRRYHTVEHLDEVLAAAGALLAHCSAADEVAVGLAAWFHDAVYEPSAGAGANEAASAALAGSQLGSLGLSRSLIAEVHRLVVLTADHRVGVDDPSGAVLVDADLAVLASSPDRYERYAADVRAEYAHVPDQRWRLGRGTVLDGFLAGERLFCVALPDDDREARARINLRRERAALGPIDRPDPGP